MVLTAKERCIGILAVNYGHVGSASWPDIHEVCREFNPGKRLSEVTWRVVQTWLFRMAFGWSVFFGFISDMGVGRPFTGRFEHADTDKREIAISCGL